MENRNVFKFISRLLIAFGILFINLFLFTALAEYICMAVYKIDVISFSNSSNFLVASNDPVSALRLFQGIVSFGTFGISAIVISLVFKQNVFEYLGLSKKPKAIYLLAVPIVLLAFMPFLSWLIEMNGQLKLPAFMSSVEAKMSELEKRSNLMYEVLLQMDGYGTLLINLIVMALIPAVGEELFCRGVLLNIFYDYSGKVVRAVVSVAFIFTLLHLQVYKFAPMMGMAIMLGLFVNWSQSIWPSIFYHFLNNAMMVIGTFYYNRGIKNYLTDNSAHMPIILSIASFFITIALVIFLNKKSQKIEPEHE
jgi:membrane protease YdiL (CAAX protease family)